MENYFNYFTEIEEHFQQRRGGGLLLSTLDWSLIEIWKDAGLPLEAVLRGIDAAFDNYDRRPSKVQKINGLAYCAQAVLVAAEEMKQAETASSSGSEVTAQKAQTGFQIDEIASFLKRNAAHLRAAGLPEAHGIFAHAAATAATLEKLAEELQASKSVPRLEGLEQRLTVMEDKLFALLLAAAPDEEIIEIRFQANRDLLPYRGKMQAAQIQQLQKQYLHKRLLEKCKLPRLSLFYM